VRRALLAIGALAAIAGLVAGALWGRQWWLRRERDELLQREASRAPVANPSLQLPRLVTLPPATPSCVTGVVLLDRQPAAGALVSAAVSPPGPAAGCPCTAAPECQCTEGLRWALDTVQPGMGLVDGAESTTTDGEGHFRLCGEVHPRLVWAETSAGALGVSPVTPTAVDGEAPLLIELAPRETMTGRVVGSANEPVAGARVLVLARPAVTSGRAVSASDGTFSLSVPPQSAVAIVDAPGFPPREVVVDWARATTIVLAPSSTLWVRAQHLGAPVASATVTLGRSLQGVTGADGLARFSEVSPSGSLAIVAHKGHLVGRTRAKVTAGERHVFVELVEGGVLRGQVRQSGGAPPRYAHLSFTGEEDQETQASADGHFESRPLSPGAYTVRATSPECLGVAEEEVVLGAGELEVALTLPCEPGLDGTVVDAQGAPVNQAEVVLECGPHRAPASTDTRGAFRLPSPTASCWLKVSKVGYRAASIAVEPKARVVNVVLDAGASLSGRVVDERGQGVRGATVVIVPAVLEDLLTARGGTTETDRDGRYALGGLGPGRLVVAAAHARGTGTSAEVVLDPGQARDGLDIRLAGAALVRGRVTDERHRPIAGASVRLAPTDEKGLFGRSLGALARGDVTPILSAMPADSSTDVDGRFELRPAGDTDYTLGVSARGFGPFEREVRPGAEVTVALERSHVAAIRGRAVDERGPLTAFVLNDEAVASEDGRFTLELGEREERTLRLSAPGHARVARALVADEVEVGDVQVPMGRRVSVSVNDEGGGPLGGVRLGVASGPTAVTDARGHGVLEGLGVGAATLTATKVGWVEAKKSLVVEERDEAVELSLRPARGAIWGVAHGVGGPLAGVAVELRPSWASMTTSADGAFRFEGLEPGTYAVVVTREGSTEARRVEVSEAPIEVGFGPEGATLEGAARIGGVETAGGVVVAVQGASASFSGEQLIDPGREVIFAGLRSVWAPVRAGRFHLEGLSPGPWALYVVNLGDVLTEQIGPAASVVLSAAETRRLELTR